MSRRSRFALLLLLGLVAGCSQPPVATGCDGGAACPTGQSCVAGRCAMPVDAGRVDATVAIDSATTDGSPADALVADTTIVGQRCSAARPCASGFVCEEGACAIDCGANARCTAGCCAAGAVCYLGACTTPGASCGAVAGDAGSGDGAVSGCRGVVRAMCPTGQQCDPSIGRCLPVPATTTCEFRPTGSFAPVVLWAWTHSAAAPTFAHVIATPAVADLDGDGASDIIVPVVDVINGSPTNSGILCALSGAGDCAGGPRELWCTAPTAARVNWLASVAVGDLTGSGELTIIAGDARPNPSGLLVNGLAAYDARGRRIPGWGTTAAGVPVDVNLFVGAPAIADLDGDGRSEVIAGYTVFDSTGRLRWQHAGAAGNNNFGPITVAADLDGDGRLEVVGGNMAYRADGTEFWAAGVAARGFPDGWPAVADFDGDGQPEVVVVSQGTVRVFTRTGALFATAAAMIAGSGGPPTIADLDGDRVPEIAVAGSNSLTTFKVGAGAGHPLTRFWSIPSRDFSSNFTGSSVFDFDGDGRTEVIYGDECFARVYAGPGDGAGGTTTRFQVPNTSCTGTEYPVVADVNGDGKAEFIVVSNNASGMATACSTYAEACAAMFPGYTATNGVRVYRDGNDNWVATRGIWNQHSYHVTNVCDGRDAVCPAGANRYGASPARESDSWRFPATAPLNRYRANAQLAGAFNAADLVPRDLRADLSQCGTALGLRATVTNIGAIGVPAGIPVAFYRLGADGGRTLIGIVRTTRVLLPGSGENVRFDWSPLPADARGVPLQLEVRVNDDGMGATSVNECNAANNAAPLAVTCSDIG